jgi:hypothetical protein
MYAGTAAWRYQFSVANAKFSKKVFLLLLLRLDTAPLNENKKKEGPGAHMREQSGPGSSLT